MNPSNPEDKTDIFYIGSIDKKNAGIGTLPNDRSHSMTL